MNFLKDPRTNWKYLLIVVIFATIFGGGILGYQYWWLPKQESKLTELKTPEKEQELEGPEEKIKEESEKEQGLEFSGFLWPGDSEEVVFPVDGDNLNISGALMGEESPSFELIDPRGNKIVPAALKMEEFSLFEETQGRDDICVQAGEGGLVMIDCFVAEPDKGEWKVRIASGLEPKIGIIEEYLDWSLYVYQKSDISFEFDTIEEVYSVESSVAFRGTLLEGEAPLKGANIEVKIGPSVATIKHTLNLFDDGKHNDLKAGDGAYGNEWTNPEAGHLLAQAEVTGKLASGVPYMRQGSVWFTVEPKSAYFSDEYNDFAIDENKDGLFDKLRIEVGVVLRREGEYGVHGTITELDGEKIQWGWTSDLISGKAGEKIIAELNFPKEAFVGRKIDGPVVLSELWLMDKSVDLRTDSRENAYTTKNYQNLNFSGWEARLAGPIKDRGVDTDGNGKFDYLEVELPVEVRRPGAYIIQSLLLGVPNEHRSNTRALEEDTAFNFSPGVNTLTLSFSGPRIAMYATDGPYIINNFQLVGPLNDLALAENEVGKTLSYSYLDFEQDTMSPTTSMSILYKPSVDFFQCFWEATDPDPSIGVEVYFDVQYRIGQEGVWTDWLKEVKGKNWPFGPSDPVVLERGETYYFRVRARDFAGNQESYRGGDGDAYVRIAE